jgi:uncharacterized membrane-anchored protein YhcB (DUF1043 family)
MDSSKIINVDTSAQSPIQPQSSVDFADVNLDAVRAESLAKIAQLQTLLADAFRVDIGEIQELLSKSFRHFLLEKEQERMPFLQRVMTAHIENMEDERGFPPRHPVHWFKSKLEFSSTGVLEFDFKKDAELFVESALEHIETEVKDRLSAKKQATVQIVDRSIIALKQDLSDRIQSVARARKIISTEYVNSFIQTDRLVLKVIGRFYFISMGERFNPKQELIYSEVCVRPTGIFDRSKDGDKPTQLKYAISCDRLLDVVNESIARSIGQIQQQTQAYLNDELVPQIDKLFQDLAV